MNARVVRYAIALTFILSSGACYYDNEELLYPGTTCTTLANPTFSVDILPLMNARCNGCHAGAFASAGIRLDSYREVIKHVNSGSLLGSITHAAGYSAMPKNTGKMSGCEIQKIQSWISSGIKE
ncbi:MAG TPA: hypothetical protein VFT90_09870 [Chryseosolibacter sp.]|nr:hypothetical protein [Chryseosolibacter sp.]